ncbi:hypothetical protein BC940DRAFT_82809 [Gongronella butleri]|nr:hypothetical protein BC940DRAFT_82809 [Gongronella butleri]
MSTTQSPIDLQRLTQERKVLFQKEVEAGKLPSDTWPDLNDAAKVKNCYFYLSLIERFWNMMDALDVEVKEYYMARAETRYEKFVRSFEHHTGESPLPPLDVAVFWHAHALSPFRFYEDIMVRYPAARNMFDKGLPLMSIYHARNTIPKYHLERWNRWIPDEPYDLLDEIKDGTRKRFKLTCWEPLCEATIEIPWRKYVQYRFHDMDIHFPHTCASGSESTKSHTSLNQQAKLKLDADVRAHKVAGTLLERNGEDRRKENQIVEYIRIHKTVVPLDNDFDLGYEAAIQDALEALGSEYENDANQFLHAVRTCYKSNPTMFSLDLIHAVRRQRKFYDAVTRMTWRFPDGYCTAIRRYHDFLSLMKYDPKLIAVPSIEIDCAWHTHMLFSGLYHAFCLRHMKRVINHDDTIPESKLLQHSVSTNNAWKSSNIRYKIGGKVETGQTGWSSGYKKVLTASLIPNQTPFGADYNAGKIMLFLPLDENFLKNLNTEYNKGMKTVDGMLAASRSAHSERIEPDKKETISNTYELNDEALKSIQKAITNSMYNNSSYGYVG